MEFPWEKNRSALVRTGTRDVSSRLKIQTVVYSKADRFPGHLHVREKFFGLNELQIEGLRLDHHHPGGFIAVDRLDKAVL